MLGSIATAVLSAAAVGLGAKIASYFDVAFRPGLVLGLGVLTAAAVYIAVQTPASWTYAAWLGVLVAGWAALALTDAFRQEIPDLISFPFLALGMGYQFSLGLPMTPTLVSIAGLFGLAVLAGLTARRWRESIGGGDVVLLGITLAWLGPFRVVDVLVLGCFLLIPQIAHQFVTGRDRRMALAPALGLATVAIWVTGPLF